MHPSFQSHIAFQGSLLFQIGQNTGRVACTGFGADRFLFPLVSRACWRHIGSNSARSSGYFKAGSFHAEEVVIHKFLQYIHKQWFALLVSDNKDVFRPKKNTQKILACASTSFAQDFLESQTNPMLLAKRVNGPLWAKQKAIIEFLLNLGERRFSRAAARTIAKGRQSRLLNDIGDRCPILFIDIEINKTFWPLFRNNPVLPEERLQEDNTFRGY